MRIISSFHDYYDSVQRHGMDKACVYVRETREEKLKLDNQRRLPYGLPGFVSDKSCFVIGFCGKLYPAMRLSVMLKFPTRSPDTICFGFDAVDEYVRRKLSESFQSAYFADERLYRFHDNGPFVCNRSEIRKWFDAVYSYPESRVTDLMIKNRSPAFLYHDTKSWGGNHVIEWNCKLAGTGFVSLFDPFQAYQQLHMFMSNLAEDRKVMPVISDEMKAHTHGFDKHSFRAPFPRRVGTK